MTKPLVSQSSQVKPNLAKPTQKEPKLDHNPTSASSSFSVAQICAHFIHLEQKLELFAWQIKGVYIWPLLRMPLYYELTRKLGVFGAPHGSSNWKGRRFKRAKLWSYAFLRTYSTQ